MISMQCAWGNAPGGGGAGGGGGGGDHLEEHLGVAQLLGDIMCRGSRHLDPSLREQGTCREHERDVEEGMDGICRQVAQGGGG